MIVEQMSNIESDLAFVAARKLDTSLEGLEHPQSLLDEMNKCKTEASSNGLDAEDCHQEYFRFVFGELPAGDLTLLTWGTTEFLPAEEAAYGYLSSDSIELIDAGPTQPNKKRIFIDRFEPHVIAHSCLQLIIEAGESHSTTVNLLPPTDEAEAE